MIGPVWFRLCAEARSRWRTWAGLALLIGVFSGAVIATAAGARRSDTAYPRFVVAQRAADLLVYNVPSLGQVDFDTVASQPEVQDSARSVAVTTTNPDLALNILPGGYGTRFNRFKLLSGRLPDPRRADEADIGFTLADSRHLKLGSRVPVDLVPAGDSAPRHVELRVVGIEASPGEFPPLIGTNNRPVWVGAGFAAMYGAGYQTDGEVLALRFRRGSADVRAVSDRLPQLSGGSVVATGAVAEQAVGVQRSLHLQAVALLVLGVLGGLTVLLVCGQLLVRQTRLESTDHPALSAIGMTGAQLWLLGLGRAAVIGAGGALVAAAVAVGASPLFPVGLARTAEPTPGPTTDVVTIGVGMVIVLVGLVVVVGLASWRPSHRAGSRPSVGAAGSRRPSTLPDLLARMGSAPTLTAGVRMSLDPGRGRAGIPVRTTIIGSALAVAALATSLTLQASLSHLLSTPRLYGVAFDGAVEGGNGTDNTVTPVIPLLLADPEVTAVAVGLTGIPMQVGPAVPPGPAGSVANSGKAGSGPAPRSEGRSGPAPRSEGRSGPVAADGLALDVRKGSFPPLVIEGRAPSGPDEIAVGSRTLRDLDAHVGQSVEARITESDSPPSPVRIVGRAVLPQESSSSGLGKGTVITGDGLRRLGGNGDVPGPFTAVVHFKAGVDKAQARAQLEGRLKSSLGQDWTVAAPDKPTDVVNFGQVQNLPVFLAAVLALLAAATIGHLLVSSVRRRRHELAVLKSLGFVRRQIVATVCWQATTLMAIALGIGVPLGVVVGRRAWGLLADQLGILPRPTVPLVGLLALAPAALLLANAIAAIPAWSAGRTQAAVVLRSE